MARDKEQRRQQILDIATAVFAEKGYHDAHINDIVVRANIARGTFYLYFEDKRAIFEHIVDAFLARLNAVIRVIELEDPEARPWDELRSNVHRVVALFAAEPLTAQILLSAAVGLDADFDRKLLAFYDVVTATIGRALEQGEAAGLVRPGNLTVRAHCITGMLKELLYQHVLRKSEGTADELAEVVLDLVGAGIFTDVSARALRGA